MPCTTGGNFHTSIHPPICMHVLFLFWRAPRASEWLREVQLSQDSFKGLQGSLWGQQGTSETFLDLKEDLKGFKEQNKWKDRPIDITLCVLQDIILLGILPGIESPKDTSVQQGKGISDHYWPWKVSPFFLLHILAPFHFQSCQSYNPRHFGHCFIII